MDYWIIFYDVSNLKVHIENSTYEGNSTQKNNGSDNVNTPSKAYPPSRESLCWMWWGWATPVPKEMISV